VRGNLRRRLAWTAAVVAAAAVAVWVALAPPALPDGLVPAEGTYDVRILRDTWGVPHVFGRRDADVAYGLAWAHAEDDLPTIQGALLAARGELAAVYGRDMAPNDYMVQLLRIHDVVDEGYPRLPADVRAVCDAFAAGVNHYAALHPEQALARLYPVRGEDVVAGFVHKIPLFFGMDGVLKELFEDEAPHPLTPSPTGAATGRSQPPGDGAGVRGSNGFAVAPSRTADGSTFLAINSHQPWEGPVAWYEAHLHSDEGWDMVGGVFPGAPVVLHGHNRDLGWAHTVNRPDLIDVYALDVDPDDPDRYRFDGEWKTLEKRTAPIEVKLWERLRWTFEREVLWSVHGPVVRRPHGTYAVRFANFGEVRQVEQWLRMNKARTFDEWRSAMAIGALPMFNTVYGDREGNVEYVYNARLPLRAPGYDWSQDLPGDTSETLWTAYLPYEQLPRVTNPPSGFVQNANNVPFQTTVGEGNPKREDYPESFGIEDEMTNRGWRLIEQLGGDESITEEELYASKFDTSFSPRSAMAELVAEVLTMPAPDDELTREALAALSRWDFDTDVGNLHAALPVLAFGRYFVGRFQPPEDDAELFVVLREAAEVLKRHHGGLEVPWGEVNRLRRGDLDLAVGGGPEVLHAVYGELEDDGRLRGRAGDSYVLMVAWDPDGNVRSRSIHQYGSATLDETSPHYADQAPLFVRRELKPVWMDEAEVRAHLEREYRPGEM
jgi:penicillin amidase/acyl-homoserine-lactone acylase